MQIFQIRWIPWSHVLGCPPFPLVVTIVVTSKVSTFLVGDFNKPSKSSARISFEKNDHTPPYHFDSLFIWKKLCICMICSKREAYMMRFTKNYIIRLHGLRDMKHDTFYHVFSGIGGYLTTPAFWGEIPLAECEAERLSEVVLRKHQRRCLQEIFGALGGWGRSPCLRGGEEVENLVSVGGFCLGG